MSEQGKYNTSNALGLAAKGVNAVATGNYTGFANTLTNLGVNALQGQALKSTNGTVVGYVMNELGNLGYVNGTLSKGPIQTASFAGSLVNAATTAIKSPVSFATSLAENALGTVTGIDGNAAINNIGNAINTVVTNPSSITNGLANAIGIGSSDSSSSIPTAPSQPAGTTYNATNYFDSSTGNGQGTGASAGTTSQGTSLSPSTPSTPSYANNPSPYTSTLYQVESSYTSNNSTERLITNNSSNRKDVKYDPYSEVKKANVNINNDNTPYSKINTLSGSEFAKTSTYANYATGYRSLASFLNHINDFGVLVQNNFEVEFSGIDGLTLFVMNFEIPGSKLNTCEIFYDGIKVTIPVNYEHEHEFSMTLMNDALGYIYSIIKSYIEFDSYNHKTDPGTTMIVRAFTGQADCSYTGSRIYAKGVRLVSMSGLSYGQSSNDIQTFTVNGTLIEYSHLPYYLSPVF